MDGAPHVLVRKVSSVNATMRAAVLHQPGDIRVEDIPVPALKPGHVLLRVAACGVCGSDIARMLSKGAHRMPLVCGHEFSGTVVDAADDSDGVAIGDLVTVPPLIPCRRCEQCQRGRFSLCEDYDYFGSRRDGAYTEFVLSPVDNVLLVPDGVDPTAAAMTDPAAIALHAIRRAPLPIGSRVAVVGCGPIGLFGIQWARLAGASDVMAVDLSPKSLVLAREAGATATAPPDEIALTAEGFDLVLEAAGAPVAEDLAVRMAAPGGHVSFVGIPNRPVQFGAKTFEHLLRQEVSLHGSWNSFSAPFPGDEWRTTLDKLASGDLRWKFMITHDLGIEDVPAMFDKLRDRAEFTSKILFRPEA